MKPFLFALILLAQCVGFSQPDSCNHVSTGQCVGYSASNVVECVCGKCGRLFQPPYEGRLWDYGRGTKVLPQPPARPYEPKCGEILWYAGMKGRYNCTTRMFEVIDMESNCCADSLIVWWEEYVVATKNDSMLVHYGRVLYGGGFLPQQFQAPPSWEKVYPSFGGFMDWLKRRKP